MSCPRALTTKPGHPCATIILVATMLAQDIVGTHYCNNVNWCHCRIACYNNLNVIVESHWCNMRTEVTVGAVCSINVNQGRCCSTLLQCELRSWFDHNVATMSSDHITATMALDTVAVLDTTVAFVISLVAWHRRMCCDVKKTSGMSVNLSNVLNVDILKSYSSDGQPVFRGTPVCHEIFTSTEWNWKGTHPSLPPPPTTCKMGLVCRHDSSTILICSECRKVAQHRPIAIFRYKFRGHGVDSSGSGYGPVAGSSEHDNKPKVPWKTSNFCTISFSRTLPHGFGWLISHFDGWSDSRMRFQVLTVASMKMTAFREIAPCSLAEVDRYFRCAYYLHHSSPW
jgi:hypothetical protein